MLTRSTIIDCLDANLAQYQEDIEKAQHEGYKALYGEPVTSSKDTLKEYQQTDYLKYIDTGCVVNNN